MAGRDDSSFMRSLCFGTINEDILFPWPEINAEESETLRQLRDSFSSWLSGKDEEFRKWDVKGEMPKEFLQEMRELGLFSLVIPQSAGGLGFSSAAYSRTLQELARYDGSLAVTAGAHSSIGMKALLLFGTEAQREKYYPRLVTGEMIAAFCLTEPGSGSDAASIKTRAVRNGDNWVLNGEKIWITNGGIADFFTVFARTDTNEGHLTAFIVTRDMPGVKTGPHEDKMGIRASNTTSVVMSDVTVGPEHILGQVGKGFKVAMQVLNNGRTGLGGGCVGAMKHCIELATRQAQERQQFGKPIAQFGLVRQKIGQMVIDCYTTESTVGLLCGIIDSGSDDYAVEAAITKVYASEALWRTADEALQIAAGMGYMREQPYERIMRDARINRIFEGTNEILRLFIALTAMNDVGRQLKEVASVLGNVLDDPIKGFGVLSDYARRRVSQATGIGKATMTKAHPTLRNYTEVFETLTVSLAGMVDRILRKHGKNIVDKQFATRRLGDIMIDLYTMAANISRVSAAIEKNGPEKSVRESDILAAFCHQASRRIRANLAAVDDNEDEIIKSLADHAVDKQGYSWDLI